MNYWITTHWPARESDPVDVIYTGVWVQNGKEHVAAKLGIGDLVFKYESRTGPTQKRKSGNGKSVSNPCRQGRMGIVAIMKVESGLSPRFPDREEYTDGEEKWWRYFADASSEDSEGFVPLAKLNSLLGFKPGNNMRGFGDDHSGLKQIDKATFDEIFVAFKEGK